MADLNPLDRLNRQIELLSTPLFVQETADPKSRFEYWWGVIKKGPYEWAQAANRAGKEQGKVLWSSNSVLSVLLLIVAAFLLYRALAPASLKLDMPK